MSRRSKAKQGQPVRKEGAVTLSPERRRRNRRVRIAIRVFVLGVPLAVIYLGLIAGFGLMVRPAHADVAIVLGNEVLPDGRPSPRLCARLNRAYQIYKDKWCENVIVSGGRSRSGFDEATVMRDYLVEAGIPPGAVVLDSAGVDTAATARNSAVLMHERNWSRALVVSQYFHIVRSEMACLMEGISVVGAGSPIYFEWRDVYSLFREAVAIPVYAVRGGVSALLR